MAANIGYESESTFKKKTKKKNTLDQNGLY